MRLPFIFIMLAGASQDTDAYKPPPELVRAAAQRDFRSARIEWMLETFDGPEPRTSDGTAQFTRYEFLVRTDHGITPSNIGPQPFTQNVLRYEDEYWTNHNDSRMTVGVWPEDRHNYFDIRALGMAAHSNPAGTDQAIAHPMGSSRPISYEVVQDGPYRLVTGTLQPAHQGAPQRQHKWWIDPSRGWSVVRCQSLTDGEVNRESITTLKKSGDVWFPETVQFFDKRFEEGRQPATTLTVTRTVFNDPSLPTRLTPNDIGVEVGTNVNRVGPDGKRGIYGWDGEKILKWRVMAGKVNRGDLKIGDVLQRQRQKSRAENAAKFIVRTELGLGKDYELGIPRISMRLSAWELYVKRFIAHYELDRAQQERAWAIYRDCKAMADKYMASRADQFKKITRREREAVEISDKADRRARLDEIAHARAELLMPVAKIFKDQLKRRLAQIPTRKQEELASSKKSGP